MTILVFDSGVGGLSILDHISAQLPNDIVYLADHAAYPYGNLTENQLTHRVLTLLDRAQSDFNADLIIVGCNTASTLVLPQLRDRLNIPIIGVVPAIKTAALATNSQHIGLLATPGTISRQYIDDLIQSHAIHCNVTRLGTTKLVHMAENKVKGIAVNLAELEDCISPLINSDIDCIVLGCTHFPLLKDDLKHVAPHIQWIDSGKAIARRATDILNHSPPTSHSGRVINFLSTATPQQSLTANLQDRCFNSVEYYPF